METSGKLTAFAAADALRWLVMAGADCPVDETPRNWLAAPALTPAPTPPRSTAPDPARASMSSIAPRLADKAVAAPAAALAAAAVDLSALQAALANYDHPLRQAVPPQLISGAGDALVLADLPDDDPAVQRLAERMLAAIGLEAGTCRRVHLLPWAPPAGRPPRETEIAAFAPFVARAILFANPRAILALGTHAATFSGQAGGIASLRGKWLAGNGVPLLATFHPRLLLKQPELKRLAWADLQAFAARLAS